jgi:RNA polymerase sigma factor (TIGR02999 family)
MLPPDENVAEITVYLKRLTAGDTTAENLLSDAVYAHLQRMARALMVSEPRSLTIQPTALVNKVLMELVRLRSIEWEDRAHFFRVASRMLRRRLVDHIRERRAAKRPQKGQQVELEGLILPAEERFDEILLVHEGLDKLAKEDPELVELVEMIYFGGLSVRAAAEVRGVSEKTIDRNLDFARRWLKIHFCGPCPRFDAASAPFSRG